MMMMMIVMIIIMIIMIIVLIMIINDNNNSDTMMNNIIQFYFIDANSQVSSQDVLSNANNQNNCIPVNFDQGDNYNLGIVKTFIH